MITKNVKTVEFPQFNETVVQCEDGQVNAATGSLLDNTKFLKNYVEQHEQNQNNPHGVTKEQLGLSNVENVPCSDMKPEFAEAVTRENIKYGENLSIILGKTQKYFTDLKDVSFTGDYNSLVNKPVLGSASSKETVNNCNTTEEGFVLDARQGQALQSGLNQTKDSLWNHKVNKDNPHGVTKEQLGLGAVENKPVGELTPEFTEPLVRENLQSGEKLSLLFGKTKKFFTDLKNVSFTGNYNDLIEKPVLGDASAKTVMNDCTATKDGYVLDARQGQVLNSNINQAKETMEKHKNDKNNPHGVTKQQLGLDLVENVPSSGLTPVFTEAPARVNLNNGETLGIMIGKIKKFFTDLKPVAFSGNYNDLQNRPTLGIASTNAIANNCNTTADGYVLDARQGQILQSNINQVASNLGVTNNNLSAGLNGCKITFDGTDFYAANGTVKKKLGNGVLTKIPLSGSAVKKCTINISDFYSGSFQNLTVDNFICDVKTLSSKTSYTGSDDGPGSGSANFNKSFNNQTGVFTASAPSIKTAANKVRNDCSFTFIPYLIYTA